MREACKNIKQEHALTNEGFFVLPFLTDSELNDISTRMDALGFGAKSQALSQGLTISVIEGNPHTRAALHQVLIPLFEHAVSRCFADYRIARVAVFDKKPGGRGVRVHQHTSLVDERQCRSLTVWIPLQRTTPAMGTLKVVRFSHLFTRHIRSYDDFADTFANVSADVMERVSETLCLDAGEAVVFDDQLVHWSSANTSNLTRTAIQLELVPLEEKITVHYRKNDDELEAFEIDDPTYQTCAMTDGPPLTAKTKGKRYQRRLRIDNDTFIAQVKAAGVSASLTVDAVTL